MDLDTLLTRIHPRQTNAPPGEACSWQLQTQEPATDGAAAIYHNCNPALTIDFLVQRLPLAGLEVMEPRLVRIAPGARNECHRHAHESIFVVLTGQGELRLGEECVVLKTGDVACVPRWVVHQSLNTSAHEDLLLLAITDFGLTSAVLGDYDRRTRLKGGGVDAFVAAGSVKAQVNDRAV